jgi:AcrR family transcriptional regulator
VSNLGPTALAGTDALLPPRATADGTMRRLLESSLELFGARGFHGVSVREIAQAGGVRASSIYAHFPSKEAILAELMMVGHEEHREWLRAALLDAGAAPADQIRAVVRAHVGFHATYSLLARVGNRELAALAPPSLQGVAAIRLDDEHLFLGIIERGMRLGAFRVEEPWLAFAALGSMGIRVAEWWDQSRGFSVEQVANRYAEFAVKLLT